LKEARVQATYKYW